MSCGQTASGGKTATPAGPTLSDVALSPSVVDGVGARLPVATPTARPTAWLSVSADGKTKQTEYSLQTTRELFIRTELAELSGQHVVTLKVFSPSGAKYDELHAVLTDRAGAAERVRIDVGPPQGLELLRMPHVSHPHVDLVLPVAGTFITQQSLSGKWTISAHLDGEEVPRAVTSVVLQ